MRTGNGAWGQVRAGRFRWTITIDVRAHRVWGKQGQAAACSNLQGQVPARGGQCGQGWAWKHVTNREKQRCHHFFCPMYEVSLTCWHKRGVIELPQSFFHLVSLFLLHEGLETTELLQHRGGLASACYADQKVVQCPRQERWLVCMQRGWRSTEEVRVGMLIKGIDIIFLYPTLEGSRDASSVVLLHN